MSRKTKDVWQSPGRAGTALRALADALLLLLLLPGTAFTISSVYDLEIGTGFLLGFSALSALVLAGVCSLPKRRWIAWLALLALYAALLWKYCAPMLGALLDQVDIVLPDLNWTAPAAWADAAPLSDAQWLTLLLPALFLALGWCAVRRRSWWLTVLLSAACWLPGAIRDGAYPWLPLMAQAVCWCALFLTSLCGRSDPRGAAKFTLLCLPAAALLLAVLSTVIPETYEQPAWTEPVRERLEDAAARLTESESIQDLLTLGAGADVSTRLDDAGPRRFSGRTVMTVETDVPGRVYLRGTSAAVYTGDAWEPLDDEDYAELGLDASPAPEALCGVSPLNFAALSAPESEYHEMTIDYGASLSGCMYTPYQLLTAPDELSGVDFVNDSYLQRQLGVREKNLYYRPYAQPPADGYSLFSAFYRFYHTDPLLLTGAAAEAEETYRSSALFARYLEIPDSFQETVNEWASSLQQTVSAADASIDWGALAVDGPYFKELTMANWVAAYLDLTCEYDLDAPYTPEGEDFVDYFLNESRRGYCVHFATAGTLLLRACGVPARYVTGYTVDIPASGTAQVLDSDAHAWVEIYLNGYGWYPVEMTPSSGTGIEPSAAAGGIVQSDEPEEQGEPDEPEETPDAAEPTPAAPQTTLAAPETREEPEKTSKVPAPVRWTLLALLLLAAVPLRAALARLLRRHRFESLPPPRAVLLAYAYLERLRPWGYTVDEAALDLARQARFSCHPPDEQDRAQMRELTESARADVLSKLSPIRRLRFLWICGL